MATAEEFVAERFRKPHIADYMASLSQEERAVFNQGKDCSLAIIASWLSEGGDLDPYSLRALDEALSHAVGFTRDGFPIEDAEDCPGHVASDLNPKVCRYCSTHVDSERDEQVSA